MDASATRDHISIYKPIIDRDRVFFSDLHGNQVYIVPIVGADDPLSVGSPPAVSAPAQSPYGLVVGAHDRIFINERMRSRVKLVTWGGDDVASISHRGNADEIHLVNDGPQRTILYLVGPAVCAAQTVCSSRRIELVDDEVVRDDAFDAYDANPSVMTWTGGVDRRTGYTYVANVGSNEVRVFNSELEQVDAITLAVPDSVALRGRSGSARRPYAYSEARMYRMVVAEDKLYVQWIASPLDAASYRFVLSVYDLEGDVLVSGVSTDLQLASASDTSIVFWRSGSSGTSNASVYRYSLR